jgi:hypothetical protein
MADQSVQARAHAAAVVKALGFFQDFGLDCVQSGDHAVGPGPRAVKLGGNGVLRQPADALELWRKLGDDEVRKVA